MKSPPFPQKSFLALLALVPAFLIPKSAKRTPKERRLLKDLKDVTDADRVVVQQLFDSEFDIIIVGGGRSPFVSILGTSADTDLPQEPRAVFSPPVSPRNPVFGCYWSNLVKGTVDFDP